MMNSSNVENVSPHVIKQVAKELTQLSGEPPEGIKVFLNDEDVTDIQAAIDGPAGTPYAGGLFRMKLVLTKNFPHEPPKAFFLTKIFHPNVASNGEICVNTLKKDWKPELGIRHILLTVKCLLIVPNPESALNEEAGKLLLEQYDDYSLRAKLYTDIHAKHPVDSQGSSTSDGPLAKKHAGDKKLLDKKKKEKKKVLKRCFFKPINLSSVQEECPANQPLQCSGGMSSQSPSPVFTELFRRNVQPITLSSAQEEGPFACQDDSISGNNNRAS